MHEQAVQKKEVEYSYGINKIWSTEKFFTFSSFRSGVGAIYHRIIFNLFCIIFIAINAFQVSIFRLVSSLLLTERRECRRYENNDDSAHHHYSSIHYPRYHAKTVSQLLDQSALHLVPYRLLHDDAHDVHEDSRLRPVNLRGQVFLFAHDLHIGLPLVHRSDVAPIHPNQSPEVGLGQRYRDGAYRRVGSRHLLHQGRPIFYRYTS